MEGRWRDVEYSKQIKWLGEWASVSRMQIKTTPSFRNLICRWEERTLLHEPNGWLIASDCLTVCRSACLAVWQGRMWMWDSRNGKNLICFEINQRIAPGRSGSGSGGEQTKLFFLFDPQLHVEDTHIWKDVQIWEGKLLEDVFPARNNRNDLADYLTRVGHTE